MENYGSELRKLKGYLKKEAGKLFFQESNNLITKLLKNNYNSALRNLSPPERTLLEKTWRDSQDDGRKPTAGNWFKLYRRALNTNQKLLPEGVSKKDWKNIFKGIYKINDIRNAFEHSEDETKENLRHPKTKDFWEAWASIVNFLRAFGYEYKTHGLCERCFRPFPKTKLYEGKYVRVCKDCAEYLRLITRLKKIVWTKENEFCKLISDFRSIYGLKDKPLNPETSIEELLEEGKIDVAGPKTKFEKEEHNVRKEKGRLKEHEKPCLNPYFLELYPLVEDLVERDKEHLTRRMEDLIEELIKDKTIFTDRVCEILVPDSEIESKYTHKPKSDYSIAEWKKARQDYLTQYSPFEFGVDFKRFPKEVVSLIREYAMIEIMKNMIELEIALSKAIRDYHEEFKDEEGQFSKIDHEKYESFKKHLKGE